jgi:hypothetical protein
MPVKQPTKNAIIKLQIKKIKQKADKEIRKLEEQLTHPTSSKRAAKFKQLMNR